MAEGSPGGGHLESNLHHFRRSVKTCLDGQRPGCRAAYDDPSNTPMLMYTIKVILLPELLIKWLVVVFEDGQRVRAFIKLDASLRLDGIEKVTCPARSMTHVKRSEGAIGYALKFPARFVIEECSAVVRHVEFDGGINGA